MPTPFDPRAYVGRPVKELDQALRLHLAGKASAAAPAPTQALTTTTPIASALADLANEEADSNVRRNAALKIGSLRADLNPADAARLVSHQ